MQKAPKFASAFPLVAGSWLVPGLGFIARGNYWRGAAVFLLLSGTFLLGLLLRGTVLVPEFNYFSPTFNVVSVLTFIGQMGNGAASLFCLADAKWHLGIIRPIEPDPWFDLAALYLLVSGCMNYFCVCNVYDRYFGRQREPSEAAKSKQ